MQPSAVWCLVGSLGLLYASPLLSDSAVRRYYERLATYPSCLEQSLRVRALHADIIFTGTIRSLDTAHGQVHGAHVAVKRVIKGSLHIANGQKSVLVTGIGDLTVCHSRAFLLDSRIFLTNQQLKLNSSLLRLTLSNIEELESQIKQQRPHHNRKSDTEFGAVETVNSAIRESRDPCAVVTCSHGSQCVTTDGGSVCRCPTMHCHSRVHTDEHVCGSDNEDYANECEMRRASCQQQKAVDKKYDGYCDSCHGKMCSHNATCVSDGIGGSLCVCPAATSCSQLAGGKICGSDGRLYSSECQLRIASCVQRQVITVAVDQLLCDPCFEIECPKPRHHCADGQCVCKATICSTFYEPVCGTDFVTYPNQCTLDSVACSENLDIETLDTGICSDDFGSADDNEAEPERELAFDATAARCDDNVCLHGAVCQRQQCVCIFNCDAFRSAVCGSDGKLYANECLMKQEACKKQATVKMLPLDDCEEMLLETEMCDGKPTVMNPRTGRPYNCDNERCPADSYCHQVHGVPAQCCHGDAAAAVSAHAAAVASCHSTEYGCCSDDLTPAQGHRHAGCPSECQCNSLGSVRLTCDPVSRHCSCKTGVGGLRCDRCEPGFWGLQHIATGNTACTPCRCSVFGAVREDCDQTTGACWCHSDVTGDKCDVCPNGVAVDSRRCSA